jgi:hypothetical protein
VAASQIGPNSYFPLSGLSPRSASPASKPPHNQPLLWTGPRRVHVCYTPTSARASRGRPQIVVRYATGDSVAENVPKEFYDAVDRFIALANELSRTENVARISSVIMYAAARYNAHCMMTLDAEAAQNVQAATDYFVKQYRAMLEENVGGLLKLNPPQSGVA